MPRALIQWYGRIQQPWMAVSNKTAATVGHSEAHSKEEAHGAGSRQEQIHQSQCQQGPVLAGQKMRVRSLGLLSLPVPRQS